jgi:hypothetical protein
LTGFLFFLLADFRFVCAIVVLVINPRYSYLVTLSAALELEVQEWVFRYSWTKLTVEHLLTFASSSDRCDVVCWDSFSR